MVCDIVGGWYQTASREARRGRRAPPKKRPPPAAIADGGRVILVDVVSGLEVAAGHLRHRRAGVLLLGQVGHEDFRGEQEARHGGRVLKSRADDFRRIHDAGLDEVFERRRCRR